MIIPYYRSGDYYLPELTISESNYPFIGKYGRLRREYLKSIAQSSSAVCFSPKGCISIWQRSTEPVLIGWICSSGRWLNRRA